MRLIDAHRTEEKVKISDKPAWMVVRDMPTIDAVEVVHGRWNSVSLDPQDPYFNCTNCGIGYSTIYHECEEMKYCPNCGAKMDGGNKHDGQKEKV